MICSKCKRNINDRGFGTHFKFCRGIVKCLCCGEILKNPNNKFCSSSCAAKINSKGRKHSEETKKKISLSLGGTGKIYTKYPNCLNCEKKITGRKFCNAICQNEYQYKIFIEEWLSGKDNGQRAGGGTSGHIKKWLIKSYDNKCSICGWCEINPVTGNVPIELDHIDGNHKNNDKENVRLLCPNCHSLTPFFRALNTGRGRTICARSSIG